MITSLPVLVCDRCRRAHVVALFAWGGEGGRVEPIAALEHRATTRAGWQIDDGDRHTCGRCRQHRHPNGSITGL